MQYIPSREDFDVIYDYICKDIGREIEWAKHTENNIKSEFNGGGNYLAALGLLCYTEAMGKFLRRKVRRKDLPEESFLDFWCLLGEKYMQLLSQRPNVYGELRSAFAHEYSPQNMCVNMFQGEEAITWSEESGWTINIESYFNDFKNAVENNKNELFQ